MKRLIPLLFFVSGATALVGEVVWMRMLGLVLGNTIWAASAAVTVWMIGMAAGAAIGARLAPRIRRHILVYGVAEGVIGIYYAASPAILKVLLAIGAHLGDDMGASLGWGITQRFALALGALLPPTVLMGLTLPLLVERLQGDRLAERTGTLYGLNTLGAAAGVFGAAYWGLPLLGESGTLAAAAVGCLLVTLIAVPAERRIMGLSITAPRTIAVGGRSAPGFLVLAGLMGTAALAAELIWVRILVLHLGSRVYAFAVLLGVYLVGLGVGSLAVRVGARRLSNPTRALAWVQGSAGLVLVVQILALGHTSEILVAVASTFKFGYSFSAIQAAFLITVMILFLPVTILFGASFPLAVAADPTPRSPGQHAGAVATANTVGAIIGAVGAPFVLVPAIGCQRTLLLLAVIHLGIAVSLWRTRATAFGAAVVLVAVTLAAVTLPRDWILRKAVEDVSDSEVLLALEEDVGATVIVKEYRGGGASWLSLELNGTNVAGSSPALLRVQQLQGHLPLLQVDDPRSVLHVGFGSGGTCWAVARHPVESIDVVEISPRVLSASDHWFEFINHNVLSDPRVRTILNDGRNYLMATDRRYDVILSDSIHPVFAGNGTLYTLEYFEMCRRRLRPGGVVSGQAVKGVGVDQAAPLNRPADPHRRAPTGGPEHGDGHRHRTQAVGAMVPCVCDQGRRTQPPPHPDGPLKQQLLAHDGRARRGKGEPAGQGVARLRERCQGVEDKAHACGAQAGADQHGDQRLDAAVTIGVPGVRRGRPAPPSRENPRWPAAAAARRSPPLPSPRRAAREAR